MTPNELINELERYAMKHQTTMSDQDVLSTGYVMGMIKRLSKNE